MPDRFRKSVALIMRSSDLRKPVGESPPDRPASFGWLRRPEHDEAEGKAWELPDGEIRLLAPSPHEALARGTRRSHSGFAED